MPTQHTTPSTDTAMTDTASPTLADVKLTTDAFTLPGRTESVLDLRLTPQSMGLITGTPVMVTIPVGRPPKHCFWRGHPDPQNSTYLYTLDAQKLGGEGLYAVSAEVGAIIPDQIRPVQLRLAVTAQGAPYIVPIPQAGLDGRTNPWHESLARAFALSQQCWIRVSANLSRGCYDVFQAQGTLPDPQWPTEAFEPLLELAFQGRMITDIHHPLVQQLLGQVV